MSKLSDFNVLSFDCFGTIIDWETGILAALQPLLDAHNVKCSREDLIRVYHECEVEQQQRTPSLPYSELLATILPRLANKLNLPTPSAAVSEAFGASIGSWPAFPDSVAALHQLSKHYKLVILSNVDRKSFGKTNTGPLEQFPFDLIITAQDVGTYKPNQRNFEYMLREVKEKFGVEKAQVLQTAHSQYHDHHPSRRMGIKSCWIVRPGGLMGDAEEEFFDWKFNTLGDMAVAVDAELGVESA
ncbi:hypothetical protein TRVA0_013S01178 [Trichomonascus vanleenenianus]|uniref:uncharacterized protein n=1 Tax=Trichomonascus vanleenenianus TaxID=2268995 RepID=UPI003ECB2E43